MSTSFEHSEAQEHIKALLRRVGFGVTWSASYEECEVIKERDLICLPFVVDLASYLIALKLIGEVLGKSSSNPYKQEVYAFAWAFKESLWPVTEESFNAADREWVNFARPKTENEQRATKRLSNRMKFEAHKKNEMKWQVRHV